MDDRVFIRHPDQPHRNGYVTRRAFDSLWSRKGYVIEGDDTPAPDPAVEPVEVPPTPSQDALNAKLDEKDQLRRLLEANGIEVDGRWGLKRLRTEAAPLESTEAAE